MPKLIFTLFLLCAALGVVSQDSLSTVSFIKDARDHAVQSYYRFTSMQARLYNGIDHVGYASTIRGNAYYINDSLLTGSVQYDGLKFSPVQMMFDLYQEEVVIRHFSGLRIALLSEKMKEFDFRGRHFVRHVYDSLANSSLPTGFYDHIYEGKVTMLVRHLKRMEERVTDEVIKEFVFDDRYYLYRDGVFRQFRNAQGLYKAFGSKSGDVRRFLKKNRIKFKTDRERAIVEAAKYYDTLI